MLPTNKYTHPRLSEHYQPNCHRSFEATHRLYRPMSLVKGTYKGARGKFQRVSLDQCLAKNESRTHHVVPIRYPKSWIREKCKGNPPCIVKNNPQPKALRTGSLHAAECIQVLACLLTCKVSVEVAADRIYEPSRYENSSTRVNSAVVVERAT